MSPSIEERLEVEDQELPEPESGLPTPVLDGEDQDLFSDLKARRAALEPAGKTKVLEVEGYEGKLGVEYRYIGSEITEVIQKACMKETKSVGQRGLTLLASLDTLKEACARVMIRGAASEEWRPMKPEPIKFDDRLAQKLGFDAVDDRHVILGLFGSEHAVIQQYMKLSMWLTDTTRDVDDDFLGL